MASDEEPKGDPPIVPDAFIKGIADQLESEPFPDDFPPPPKEDAPPPRQESHYQTETPPPPPPPPPPTGKRWGDPPPIEDVPDFVVTPGKFLYKARPQYTSPWDVLFRPEMYPEDGLISHYVENARRITDVPVQHHHASIVATIAACLGPKHRIRWGIDTIAPNLFMMMLASSAARKSYALKLASRLAPEDLVKVDFPASATALLELLKTEQPWCPGKDWTLFRWDEAGALFKGLERGYNAQLPQYLCRIWDGDAVGSHSRLRGTLRVEKPCVTVLGATTEAGMLPGTGVDTRTELIEGGLFGRFWFVPGKRTELMPEPAEWAGDSQHWLTERLRELYNEAAFIIPQNYWYTYQLSGEAKEYLLGWQLHRGMYAPVESANSFWGRAEIHALKLALIYHVSQGYGPDRLIDLPTIKAAVSYVWEFLIPVQCITGERVATTGDETKVLQAEHLLQEAKSTGFTVAELRRLLRCNQYRLYQILGCVHPNVHYEMWKPVEGRGRPGRVVVWGAQALSPNARPGYRRISGLVNVGPPRGVDTSLVDDDLSCYGITDLSLAIVDEAPEFTEAELEQMRVEAADRKK